jgi:hypothetical protein
MLSIRHTAFALDAASTPWSLRASVARGIWPSLNTTAFGANSLRALALRFSAAGEQLQRLARGRPTVWSHIDRAQLVGEIRDRLRDPAIVRQQSTHLCGPVAVAVELARREPAEYVRALTELLELGRFTTIGGTQVEAEAELRAENVPASLDAADWMIAATMRDAGNMHEDVDDDARGLEAMTLWGAMAHWTRDVLGLNSRWETTIHAGELRALRECQNAVDVGGSAFLLIDSELIRMGDGETEEDAWWRRALHIAGRPPEPYGPETHARDDNWPPDHWVIFLGDLSLAGDSYPASFRLWSWGSEFLVRGTADSLGEYVYAAVTGRPRV